VKVLAKRLLVMLIIMCLPEPWPGVGP